MTLIRWLHTLSLSDVGLVGGKNASLGELIQELGQAGVRVPGGFATTADAFRNFLTYNDLETFIHDRLVLLDVNDVTALTTVGREIRSKIEQALWPPDLEVAITAAYMQLAGESDLPEVDVAVRSSATAEDLPDASFAGQQETFLNIRGVEDVLHHIRLVFASLYNDRAITDLCVTM